MSNSNLNPIVASINTHTLRNGEAVEHVTLRDGSSYKTRSNCEQLAVAMYKKSVAQEAVWEHQEKALRTSDIEASNASMAESKAYRSMVRTIEGGLEREDTLTGEGWLYSLCA